MVVNMKVNGSKVRKVEEGSIMINHWVYTMRESGRMANVKDLVIFKLKDKVFTKVHFRQIIDLVLEYKNLLMEIVIKVNIN